MASGEAQKVILHRLANETQRQVVVGFAAKRDPYGRSWRPRKVPAAWAARAFGMMQDNHPLLDKTGKMIESIRTRPVGGSVVSTGLGYLGFHQEGTVNMVARRLFPAPEMGIGPIWGDAFLKVSKAVASEFAGTL